MTVYYLADHVHACIANGYVVFLDIQNDKYTALGPEVSRYLHGLAGKRAIGAVDVEDGPSELRAAIANLLERGMLQAGVFNALHTRLPSVVKPQRDLSEADVEGGVQVSAGQVISFILAYCQAMIGVKILGNARLIKSISAKSARRSCQKGQKYSLSDLVQSFRFIRIFFYKEIDRCYFDCIVHMYFLRKYGFDPVWVFGVKMEPFYAHCWVQVEETLVTNYLGEISMFRPIMAV